MKNSLFYRILICVAVVSTAQSGFTKGNSRILNFNEAKKLAHFIHREHPYTIYCNCRYENKSVDLRSCGYKPQKNPRRAARLEWEHIVPAHAFGQAFAEWRQGSSLCVQKGRTYKGRKCAQLNPTFNQMEADLYNLWPEIGELNGLRSNVSMAELDSSKMDFGKCAVKLKERKFEPMEEAKGVVARVYMYMDQEYPGLGIISEKNQPLFAAWDKLHPVNSWECKRAKKIELLQGNVNTVLEDRCRKRNISSGTLSL